VFRHGCGGSLTALNDKRCVERHARRKIASDSIGRHKQRDPERLQNATSNWAARMLTRRRPKIVPVALADKTARIALLWFAHINI